MPAGLAPGPHTITVIAADEDGADPTPPSLAIFLDLTPPSAPILYQAPPAASEVKKVKFRFTASDDHAFPSPDDAPGEPREPFEATLRRLTPPRRTLQSSNPFRNWVSISFPWCLTVNECFAWAQPVYEAFARSLSFGIPERLRPGRYEFRIQARDSAGNMSAATTHRFRILR